MNPEDNHDGHVLVDLVTRFAALIDMYSKADLEFALKRITQDDSWGDSMATFKQAVEAELVRQILDRKET